MSNVGTERGRSYAISYRKFSRAQSEWLIQHTLE